MKGIILIYDMIETSSKSVYLGLHASNYVWLPIIGFENLKLHFRSFQNKRKSVYTTKVTTSVISLYPLYMI